MDYTLTEKEKAEWDAAFGDLAKFEMEVKRRNDRLLKVIGSFLGNGFLNDLMRVFEDLESTHEQMEIAGTPIGKFQQESEYGCIVGTWVQQWATGMEGDSFSGYICIKLKDDKYLKIPYSC